MIDAKGNRTSWTRDLQGRVTAEVRANSSTIGYQYETTTSRLKKRTDPLGQEANYEYFLDDQLKQVSYTNATVSTPTVSMTYDTTYGRPATMTDGIGTTTYSYKAAGTAGALKVASINGPLSDDTITYSYDELGRVATRTLGSVTTTWNLDALGRLESLVDPLGTFDFSYDGHTSRLAELSYPNGQTSTYSYFGNSGDRRLQEIHHQTSTSDTLSKFTYAYDVVGNITTWTQQYESTAKAYDFGYDATDQLTSAIYRTTGGSPTILTRYGYSYDAVGNRTNQQTDDAPTGWTYDSMNRLTAQAGTAQLKFEGTVNEAATVTVGGKPAIVNGSNQFIGSAAVTNGTNTVPISATDATGNTRTQEYEVEVTNAGGTFSYDANGNLTTRGTRTYSWDAENRLVQVADDGTPIASFTYDGLGRRASKTVGSTTHNFVYDGSDIVEDRISGGSTTRHVHGPAIDQPLASVTSGTATYYLADHLGSIVQTTNASEAVTLTRQYDPYGNLLQGDTASGYAFTGREWDAEIGLYYYRARYYDAGIGRFISADPIGLEAGPNLFAYVGNAPTGRIDPFGLDWLNNAANFSAGVGDTITFGLTAWIRKSAGIDGVVDRCTYSYWMGHVAGELWWTAAGGAYGLRKAGVSLWNELAKVTVTNQRWAELGLKATMSDAQKMAQLGGLQGALSQQAKNILNPAAWGRLLTNLNSGPTAAGHFGAIGAGIGLASIAVNQAIGYFF